MEYASVGKTKMAHEAETDHGTVLKPDEYAVVYSPENGYQIFMPKLANDATVDPIGLAMLAAFVRLEQDEDFREEITKWFMDRKS